MFGCTSNVQRSKVIYTEIIILRYSFEICSYSNTERTQAAAQSERSIVKYT